MVTIDTLRADTFHGRSDGAASAMPRSLDRARGGLDFRRFYASSASTLPTHASLLTGLHPWDHGVTRNGLVLDEAHETLAERLRAAGFRTSAIVSSLPVSARFGLARGFERYHDEFREQVGSRPFYTLGPDAIAQALAELDAADAAGSERQFLWLHLFDPHAPYGDASGDEDPLLFPVLQLAASSNSADFDDVLARARRLYRQDATALDTALEVLYERLERDAERLATLLVVTSDHGESFADDGSLGHGSTVSDAQLRVPCFLTGPGLAPAERDDPAGTVDLATTILDWARPADRRPLGAGTSLLDPERSPAVAFGMLRTFESDPRRLERTPDGTWAWQPLPDHLFYTRRPAALLGGNEDALAYGTELAAAEADELRRLFTVFRERLEDGGTVLELLDEESQDALESLGYTR